MGRRRDTPVLTHGQRRELAPHQGHRAQASLVGVVVFDAEEPWPVFRNSAVDLIEAGDPQNVAVRLGIRAEATLLRHAAKIHPDGSRGHHACTCTHPAP